VKRGGGKNMPEKRIQIPAERVLFEVSKDGVAILDTTTEMKEIDGNMTALCDLCSVTIGPMNNVQHIESPEAISKAVRHGYRPEEMPGQRRAVLEWPYVEGLRMDEAMHPLVMVSTGLYGKPLLNQNGAPLRLVVPWKYGFKSIKSIVKITFTETEPPTSWNVATPNEYGFYSNVNPDVNHPRWSQRTERRIGEFGKRRTLPFNGYAEQVAPIYAGMDLKKFF